MTTILIFIFSHQFIRLHNAVHTSHHNTPLKAFLQISIALRSVTCIHFHTPDYNIHSLLVLIGIFFFIFFWHFVYFDEIEVFGVSTNVLRMK